MITLETPWQNSINTQRTLGNFSCDKFDYTEVFTQQRLLTCLIQELIIGYGVILQIRCSHDLDVCQAMVMEPPNQDFSCHLTEQTCLCQGLQDF